MALYFKDNLTKEDQSVRDLRIWHYLWNQIYLKGIKNCNWRQERGRDQRLKIPEPFKNYLLCLLVRSKVACNSEIVRKMQQVRTIRNWKWIPSFKSNNWGLSLLFPWWWDIEFGKFHVNMCVTPKAIDKNYAYSLANKKNLVSWNVTNFDLLSTAKHLAQLVSQVGTHVFLTILLSI